MYNDFKEMKIWQDAISVAEKIFVSTENLPKKEDYGFTSQIRRSALSISANIAEAFGRNHKLDKMNFYYYSRGSVTETRSHLEYGKRVKYIIEDDYQKLETLLISIHKDLNKILKTLKTQPITWSQS